MKYFLIVLFLSLSVYGQALKITQFPSLTNAGLATDDVFPIVDVNVDITKKIAVSELDLRYSPLATPLAVNKIFIGSAGGVATAQTMVGDASIVASGTITLANVGTAGTYASVTTNAKGLVSSGATSLDISTAASGTLTATHGGTGISSYTTGDMNYASAANTLSKLPAPTAGAQFLRHQGTGGVPLWSSSIPPNVQRFTSGSGTYNRTYFFSTATASATTGATYTNNGVTYTVVTTVNAGASILMTGSNVPSSGGTLTKASGTGDGTITFYSGQPPSYIIVELIGGGGGGAGSGSASASSNGTQGVASTFGSSFLTANPGAGANWSSGAGTGGTAIVSGTTTISSVGGGGGQGGSYSLTANTTGLSGGIGGVSCIGGNGATTYGNSPGIPYANSGAGGGGGGNNATTAASYSGSGGGGGGCLKALILSPTATYSYAVGTGGAGGGAGTGGFVGSSGASGSVTVMEYW